MIREINSLLSNVELYYPSAREWMWDYCVYLGSTWYKEKGYDLGVYVHPDGKLSAAIVCGNEPGDYMSGDLDFIGGINGELYKETFRRANILGLVGG